MKLLRSICIASAFGANVPESSGPQCYIPDLATPDNWDSWECYGKDGSGPLSGPYVQPGTKCYLDCQTGYSEYNSKSFNSTLILKETSFDKNI